MAAASIPTSSLPAGRISIAMGRLLMRRILNTLPAHEFHHVARPATGHHGDPTCSGRGRGFRLNAEARATTPRRDGPPVLRRTLCRRATPHTPVSYPRAIGRLLPTHRWFSPFPQQVDPLDFTFEACSGFTHVAARLLADPPTAGPCPESFGNSVTLLAASVATVVHRQLPRQDLHLQEHSIYHRARGNSGVEHCLPLSGPRGLGHAAVDRPAESSCWPFAWARTRPRDVAVEQAFPVLGEHRGVPDRSSMLSPTKNGRGGRRRVAPVSCRSLRTE